MAILSPKYQSRQGPEGSVKEPRRGKTEEKKKGSTAATEGRPRPPGSRPRNQDRHCRDDQRTAVFTGTAALTPARRPHQIHHVRQIVGPALPSLTSGTAVPGTAATVSGTAARPPPPHHAHASAPSASHHRAPSPAQKIPRRKQPALPIEPIARNHARPPRSARPRPAAAPHHHRKPPPNRPRPSPSRRSPQLARARPTSRRSLDPSPRARKQHHRAASWPRLAPSLAGLRNEIPCPHLISTFNPCTNDTEDYMEHFEEDTSSSTADVEEHVELYTDYGSASIANMTDIEELYTDYGSASIANMDDMVEHHLEDDIDELYIDTCSTSMDDMVEHHHDDDIDPTIVPNIFGIDTLLRAPQGAIMRVPMHKIIDITDIIWSIKSAPNMSHHLGKARTVIDSHHLMIVVDHHHLMVYIDILPHMIFDDTTQDMVMRQEDESLDMKTFLIRRLLPLAPPPQWPLPRHMPMDSDATSASNKATFHGNVPISYVSAKKLYFDELNAQVSKMPPLEDDLGGDGVEHGEHGILPSPTEAHGVEMVEHGKFPSTKEAHGDEQVEPTPICLIDELVPTPCEHESHLAHLSESDSELSDFHPICEFECFHLEDMSDTQSSTEDEFPLMEKMYMVHEDDDISPCLLRDGHVDHMDPPTSTTPTSHESAYKDHGAPSINFNQFLEKEKLKGNGSNFTDWSRHVRIFLTGVSMQFVLEAPLGPPPPPAVSEDIKNVYETRVTRYSEIQCAILCSLEAELQKRFEHHDPCEMMRELKLIFETHAAVESYEASKQFFNCMMEEGSSVSEHMFAMSGHAKKLSDLGIVIPNKLGIHRVLQSLPPSYKNFVMNYNMQNMNKELPELFSMLKSAEVEIKKENQVLMVNKTTSFKKQGKPNKGNFKKGGKKVAAPPEKPKAGPKPETVCYYCQGKGHWKRNCTKYLADLKSGHAKKKAAFTLNRAPSKSVETTPYELWFGKKPKLSFLKVWGCDAYVKKSKGKIFVAKNGSFLEKEFLTKEVTGRKVELDEVDEPSLIDQSSAVPEEIPVQPAPIGEEANDEDHETSNEEATEPRRSTRERTTPDWYDPCLNVMIVDDNDEDPTTYEEAMMSPDSNKWQEAMKSEMGSIKTDADGNITVYKARLVAKGFRQIQGVDYDETFSPVAKLKSVRILLAIAAFFDYEIWQMDVKTAFLNGDIEEELYMIQPKGFVDPKNDGKVCKLQRSIYGLKQASRSWNLRFDRVIKDFGFIRTHGEACIYKKVSGSSVAFLILYVDDILLIGNDIELLSSVKGYLNKSFSMKDLGEAAYILGIKIYRDRSRRLIGLSQSTYLDKILKKFRMDESKKGFLPMLPGKVLSKTQGPATADERERMSKIPYASAVGSIMYAMLCTRPDIAHAVSLTSRYQSDPGMEHWTAVKNILKYLKRTKDMFLCYGGDQELVVTSYTDASWNTDPDDSKSQSGYVFILNGAAVSWSSSKQCTVAKSSTESEYIAASEASSEAVWMKRFIVELGVVPSALDPLVIYCDNTGAIANAKEPRSHKKLKHIKLRFHSIREYIEDGEVEICKVHTDLNVADPLTKALPRAKHDQHQNAMGVRYQSRQGPEGSVKEPRRGKTEEKKKGSSRRPQHQAGTAAPTRPALPPNQGRHCRWTHPRRQVFGTAPRARRHCRPHQSQLHPNR
ncbi:hypothetical protein QYE76_004227 [Lolium multiflorum]|uniref:CCHC-type domain-containing protein n=1 Tax=Lolium multiflorum TaxID=4521 RepID=A0AAD8W003_LOLMU|nr:hypothetical protein QYE76_004227 [Lolium multiflorum]